MHLFIIILMNNIYKYYSYIIFLFVWIVECIYNYWFDYMHLYIVLWNWKNLKLTICLFFSSLKYLLFKLFVYIKLYQIKIFAQIEKFIRVVYIIIQPRKLYILAQLWFHFASLKIHKYHFMTVIPFSLNKTVLALSG